MTDAIPLILQVQQSALDSKASLGEALLKAKVVCAKLGLDDFGQWVQLETGGYDRTKGEDMPDYRKIRGTPQGKNPYHGWQDIGFSDQATYDSISMFPLSTAITTLEQQVLAASVDGCFEMHYTIDQQLILREWLGHNWPLRLKLDVGAVRGVLDAVRLILVDWTIQLEKEGVMGQGMQFSGEDKASSARATETIINHFHMRDVGAFVHSADRSTVNGSVDRSLDLSQVAGLVEQIEAQAPLLPAAAWAEIAPAVQELKVELSGKKDQARIQNGLRFIGDVCVKIGTSVAASGITHAIGAILTS